jgi:hypothetical protein
MGNENSQPEYNNNSAKHHDPMGFMDFILPQDAINKSTLFLLPHFPQLFASHLSVLTT